MGGGGEIGGSKLKRFKLKRYKMKRKSNLISFLLSMLKWNKLKRYKIQVQRDLAESGEIVGGSKVSCKPMRDDKKLRTGDLAVSEEVGAVSKCHHRGKLERDDKKKKKSMCSGEEFESQETDLQLMLDEEDEERLDERYLAESGEVGAVSKCHHRGKLKKKIMGSDEEFESQETDLQLMLDEEDEERLDEWDLAESGMCKHEVNYLKGIRSKESEARRTYLEQRDERPIERVHGGINSSREKIIEPLNTYETPLHACKLLQELQGPSTCRYAKEALRFYDESQGAAYEVVQPLSFGVADLTIRGAGSDFQKWLHLSFSARPKNADCNDVSLTYFFAEFLYHPDSKKSIAMHCSIFEPSDDEGFKHGCIICASVDRFHPGPNVYCVGRLPYCLVEVVDGGYF